MNVTKLHPVLKKIAVRTFYIVGSLYTYRLALRGVEVIFLKYEDEHPTLAFTSLMLLAALIIWINVRKLSPSAKRLIFGCFVSIRKTTFTKHSIEKK